MEAYCMSFLNRLRPQSANHRYPNGEAFKQAVMEAYGFTESARRILTPTRFEVRNLSAPDGGGFWYGPEENRVELFGIQAEAAIHELAHAWADLTGFYDEHSAEWSAWPTLNRAFRADVHRAAQGQDPEYPRISFICGEYEFGNPETGFAGMFENDAERFAGLASGSMGHLSAMPPGIRRWYTQLFSGDVRGLPGS